MIEAKTKEIEAKTKEIEAKCLSKAEIKELITDECSKNTCQNAKQPTKRPAFRDQFHGQNGRPRQKSGGPRLGSYEVSDELGSYEVSDEIGSYATFD